MFFADLTPYNYDLDFALPNVRTVGWLAQDYPFPKGEISSDIINKLKLILLGDTHVDAHVNQTRGLHRCDFCGSDRFADSDPCMGSSEMWLPDLEGGFYAAPSMIFHYIRDHNYRPPEQFLNAIHSFDMSSPYNAQKARKIIMAPFSEDNYNSVPVRS